jgi:uncharacterized protein YqeY
MLKDQINKDYMTAFKERDTVKKNLLSVIKGGIQLGEKNLMVENMPDDKVLEILNQAAKSSRETISKLEDGELKDFAKIELSIIESYLPKQLSREQISAKLDELYGSGITQMGDIMKAFANIPADKKVVSELIKTRN